MVSSFFAACIQLNSKREIELNIAEILRLVDEALELGAEFITLPECTGMTARGSEFMAMTSQGLTGLKLGV